MVFKGFAPCYKGAKNHPKVRYTSQNLPRHFLSSLAERLANYALDDYPLHIKEHFVTFFSESTLFSLCNPSLIYDGTKKGSRSPTPQNQAHKAQQIRYQEPPRWPAVPAHSWVATPLTPQAQGDVPFLFDRL